MPDKKPDPIEYGQTIWFVDPITRDFVYAIDGTDNVNYYSYDGVRSGVLAHPEHISHYDLWFNRNYQLPQVKGLISLRKASEQSFKPTDEDIKNKFAYWCSRNLIAGRISRDGNVLLVISEHVTDHDLKKISSYFIKEGLINYDTVVNCNNAEKTIRDLFIKPEGAEMILSSFSKTAAGPQDLAVEDFQSPETQEAEKPKYEDAKTLALIERFKNGDKGASEELYNKYKKLLLDVVNSKLELFWKRPINLNDIESENYDLFQDVVVKFLEKLKDYDPTQSRLSTYIYKTANGLAMNILNPQHGREEKRTDIINVPHHESDIEDDRRLSFDKMQQTTEPGVSDYQQTDFINTLIENLGEKEQKIIRDYFFEDMTQEEISKDLGVSKQRVNQILSDAIKTMRMHPDAINYMKTESIKVSMIFNGCPGTDSTNSDSY